LHQLLICTVRDYTKKDIPNYSEGISRVIRYIHQHLEQPIYSEQLAKLANMSLAHFYKCFNQEVGLTPSDYHLKQRIVAAKQALRNTQNSITDIALQLGMSSSQYFATLFKKVVGITPTDYRKLRSTTS
jgi:AraC family transcriptional regulator, L-rhamnose operon regulatory protein RhaS